MTSYSRELKHHCDPDYKKQMVKTIKEIRDLVLCTDTNDLEIIQRCVNELSYRVRLGSQKKSCFNTRTRARDIIAECPNVRYGELYNKALDLFVAKREGITLGLQENGFSKGLTVLRLEELLMRAVRTQSERAMNWIRSDLRAELCEIIATFAGTTDFNKEYTPEAKKIPPTYVHVDMDTYHRVNTIAVVQGFKNNSVFASYIVETSYDELLEHFK